MRRSQKAEIGTFASRGYVFFTENAACSPCSWNICPQDEAPGAVDLLSSWAKGSQGARLSARPCQRAVTPLMAAVGISCHTASWHGVLAGWWQSNIKLWFIKNEICTLPWYSFKRHTSCFRRALLSDIHSIFSPQSRFNPLYQCFPTWSSGTYSRSTFLLPSSSG